MKRTAVINVVGLTNGLIGTHTPRISAFLEKGSSSVVRPAFPAVTCTAQSNYLTGRTPSSHGIVANGWYHRELAEVQFWKQSNHIVRSPKLWHALREADASFTCAKMFWWYNMFADVEWSVTPRPMYPADGRKFFDIYSWPYELRPALKAELGDFPFAGFWGPAAGVNSPQGPADGASRWIAESAKWVERQHQPTLNLIYLPHLDYNLQRHGVWVEGTRKLNPMIVSDLAQIDIIVGDLIAFFSRQSVEVVLLSEYGITNVSKAVHLNRLFRERGWLTLKEELGLELLDCGNSRAFAVADHQIAHVYINDPGIQSAVRSLLESTDGVAEVLDDEGKHRRGIQHERAGDLVAVAREDTWFTYYYWNEDARAPDFARCVDIHRKPGYDPVELFTDPALSDIALKAKIGWRLLQKKLGFRMLMDVIPLDASLVKGSHGRQPVDKCDWPLFITGSKCLSLPQEVDSTGVFELLRKQVLGG